VNESDRVIAILPSVDTLLMSAKSKEVESVIITTCKKCKKQRGPCECKMVSALEHKRKISDRKDYYRDELSDLQGRYNDLMEKYTVLLERLAEEPLRKLPRKEN